MSKDDVGSKGEELAKNYLLDNGFIIRHTNWRFGHKELDIIAEKNNTLHIVEIKTRTSGYWQAPEHAVIYHKQKNMLMAAEAYIKKENIDMDTQFDVISIIINNEDYKLEYIADAFVPSEIR